MSNAFLQFYGSLKRKREGDREKKVSNFAGNEFFLIFSFVSIFSLHLLLKITPVYFVLRMYVVI